MATKTGKKKVKKEAWPSDQAIQNRNTREARWARGAQRVVWAHVGTYPGDIYSVWTTKKKAKEAADRNAAFSGTIMRGVMTLDK